MAKTRLFMILGNSNPYDEEGIVPSCILSLYDDKSTWVFQRISHDLKEGKPSSYIWNSNETSLFDNAFLMITLFFNQSEAVVKLAERYFRVNGIYEQSSIDVGNTRIISQRDLNSLYKENKKELAKQYCMKIVAVMLSDKKSEVGSRVKINARMKESLIKSINKYGIKNFEICETTNGNI